MSHGIEGHWIPYGGDATTLSVDVFGDCRDERICVFGNVSVFDSRLRKLGVPRVFYGLQLQRRGFDHSERAQ